MTTELPPLPEPEVPQGYDYGERTYTAAQLRAYAAEAVRLARQQALEEAALLCIHRADLQTIRANAEGNDYATERAIEATGCAAAIRALQK